MLHDEQAAPFPVHTAFVVLRPKDEHVVDEDVGDVRNKVEQYLPHRRLENGDRVSVALGQGSQTKESDLKLPRRNSVGLLITQALTRKFHVIIDKPSNLFVEADGLKRLGGEHRRAE